MIKYQNLFLTSRICPDFDRETSQHQHKAGEHTENLRKSVAVTRFCGEAERELSEQR